jgi:uncharacterized lipoprotein YehR (DUF1307 family)
MKTFRLIGMALLAIVLCVNFIACSSSNDTPTKSKEKKLIRITKTENSGTSNTSEFIYDAQGRVTSVWESGLEYHITWGNNSLTHENIYDDIDNYELKNNKIINSSSLFSDSKENSIQYTYNNSGHITNIKTPYGEDYFTWNGDKLIKYIHTHTDGISYTCEYKYNGKTCTGWTPFTYDNSAWSSFEVEPFLYAHPELVGMRTSELPTQLKIAYYDDEHISMETIVNIYYIFDSDGYTQKCIHKNDSNKNDTTTYTYTWE